MTPTSSLSGRPRQSSLKAINNPIVSRQSKLSSKPICDLVVNYVPFSGQSFGYGP